MAVAPLFAAHRGQQGLGLHAADAGQVLQQAALLLGHLQRAIGVLQDAAAAHAEMRAARRNAVRRRLQDSNRLSDIERALTGEYLDFGALARQCALDEHDLARGVAGDAAALRIQGNDA